MNIQRGNRSASSRGGTAVRLNDDLGFLVRMLTIGMALVLAAAVKRRVVGKRGC